MACTEEISTPLAGATVVPVISRSDFEDIPLVKHDFAMLGVLYDGTDYFMLGSMIWLGPIMDHSLKYMNIRTGETVRGHSVNPKITASDTEVVISSGHGEIVHHIADNTVDLDTTLKGIRLRLKLRGKPFKFNKGSLGIIEPCSKYVKGIELPGPAEGDYNGRSVTGMAVVERLNWDFKEYDFPGYRWVAFNCGNYSGLLTRLGPYVDGGIWSGSRYIKPDRIVIVSDGPDYRMFCYSGSDITEIRAGYLGSSGSNIEFYTVRVYLNNKEAASGGLMWMELSTQAPSFEITVDSVPSGASVSVS